MPPGPEQVPAPSERARRDPDGAMLPPPGQSIERELSGGQKHSYQINLAEGQYLGVAVEQRGINVALQLVGLKGEAIAGWDRELTLQGREHAELVAETAGIYRVIVEARPKIAPSGFYEICVTELRAATERDRSLQEARKLFWESQRLWLAGKYGPARPVLEKALAIRERLLGPDHLEIASTLILLGNILMDTTDFDRAEVVCKRVHLHSRSQPGS